MALNGKVRPDCNYASNPYHECTETCLRRIAEGKGRKDKKKTGYLQFGLRFTLKKYFPIETRLLLFSELIAVVITSKNTTTSYEIAE